MTPHTNRSPVVWLLAALLAFLGVGALLGGYALASDPTGARLRMSTALLAGTPFPDYRIPGLILFVVLGLGPLVAVFGIVRGVYWAWVATLLVAFALLVWIVTQVLFVGYVSWLQPIYAGLALLLMALALLPGVRRGLRGRAHG